MSDEHEHDRFVTIPYFCTQMMGMQDRSWYWRHLNDPGMPQRIKVGMRVKLSLKDCVAFMDELKRQARPAPKKKRGRPKKAKAVAEAEAAR